MFNLAAFKDGASTKAIEEAWINEVTKKENNFILKLNATHSVLSLKLQEIRFDKRSTIAQVKEQLEYRFGSPAANQNLTLKDEQGNDLVTMDDNTKTLQEYEAQTGFAIHVVDSNPSEMMQNLDDLSQVEKYEMSEEDYNKREDTFRKFKERMIAQNPNFMNAAQ